MAPPVVKANAVADAIVTRLDLLRTAFNADLHHLQPRQVRRGVVVDPLTIGPLPAYLVTVLGWQRTRQFASRHGLTVSIGVNVLVDDPAAVESKVVAAARDIEYQLEGYETLGGLAQQLLDVTVELDHIRLGSSQLAYGLVTIPVVLTTDHSAP